MCLGDGEFRDVDQLAEKLNLILSCTFRHVDVAESSMIATSCPHVPEIGELGIPQGHGLNPRHSSMGSYVFIEVDIVGDLANVNGGGYAAPRLSNLVVSV